MLHKKKELRISINSALQHKFFGQEEHHQAEYEQPSINMLFPGQDFDN